MTESVEVGDIINLQIGVMDAYASYLSDIMALLLLQLPPHQPTIYYYHFSTTTQSSQWFQDL